jgi:hypothetical protein
MWEQEAPGGTACHLGAAPFTPPVLPEVPRRPPASINNWLGLRPHPLNVIIIIIIIISTHHPPGHCGAG